MEFFGIPVSNQILLEARLDEVLGIAKQFVGSSTYNSLLSRLSSRRDDEVTQSFFEALAGLTSGRQGECFHALVTDLKYEDVIDRLKKR